METVSVHVGIVNKVLKDSSSKPDGELVMVGLKSDDLKSIMSDLLKSSTQVPGLSIVPSLAVEIRGGKGYVKGNVSVDHSAVGHSEADVDLIFGNSADIKNKIVAEKKEVSTRVSMRTKFVLSAAGIDLDKEIRSKLSDPSGSINGLMTQAFRDNGRKLETFGANFSQKSDVLILAFKSHKI